MTRLLTILMLTLSALSCQDNGQKTDKPHDTSDTTTTLADTSKEESMFVLDLLNSLDTNGIVDTNAIIRIVLYQTTNFDNTSQSFRKDTFDFFEKTTEGGIAIATHDNTSDIFSIVGTIFGEMGKTEYEFYLTRKDLKFVYAMFKAISYDRPMYEKEMKIKFTETEHQIFHNGILIAILDDKKKKIKLDSGVLTDKDKQTKQFFTDYIGQIKINK